MFFDNRVASVAFYFSHVYDVMSKDPNPRFLSDRCSSTNTLFCFWFTSLPTAARHTAMPTTKSTVITIYAMPGSQFTGKVLVALDARKIDHYCVFVPMPLEERRKVLPSGGTMVPEMKVVVDEETFIVPDSEAILHWLDDHMQTNYFPTDNNNDKDTNLASDLSVRASTKSLAAFVWYFNWVDDEGYQQSMRRSLAKALAPSFLPMFLSGFLVDLFVPSTKAKYRKLSMEALDMQNDEAVFQDRVQMRSKLVDELLYFQSFLKSNDDDDQTYLLGPELTAADVSVYAQVERLVGDMGDTHIYPAIPELKSETTTTSNDERDLSRFWKWHGMMREKHPLKFKGKRPPKTSS